MVRAPACLRVCKRQGGAAPKLLRFVLPYSFDALLSFKISFPFLGFVVAARALQVFASLFYYLAATEVAQALVVVSVRTEVRK